MSLNDAMAKDLHNQMHIYIQQLQELQETLERERQDIRDRNFESFNRTLAHKNNLLHEVHELDQKFMLILKRVMRQPSKAAFEKLLTDYQGALAQSLQMQWQSVKKLAASCKNLNELNSKIVTHTQQHYSRIMSILRQEDPNAATYGKTGRQRNGGAGGGQLAQA